MPASCGRPASSVSSARASSPARLSMRLSPDDRRLPVAALAAGAWALGVAAVWKGYAWPDTRAWVPDLLTGWTLCGVGVAALALGRSRGAAALLFGAGVGWF